MGVTFLKHPVYGFNALTREHVNNFWDTSRPIHQTKSLEGTYTGPDAGRLNNYIHVWNVDFKALKLLLVLALLHSRVQPVQQEIVARHGKAAYFLPVVRVPGYAYISCFVRR